MQSGRTLRPAVGRGRRGFGQNTYIIYGEFALRIRIHCHLNIPQRTLSFRGECAAVVSRTPRSAAGSRGRGAEARWTFLRVAGRLQRFVRPARTYPGRPRPPIMVLAHVDGCSRPPAPWGPTPPPGPTTGSASAAVACSQASSGDTPRDLPIDEHRRRGDAGNCTRGGHRKPQPRREQIPESVELRSRWLGPVAEARMPPLAEPDELADSLLSSSPACGRRGAKTPEPWAIRAERVRDLTDPDRAIPELKDHSHPTQSGKAERNSSAAAAALGDIEARETRIAAAACCSGWFGASLRPSGSGPITSSTAACGVPRGNPRERSINWPEEPSCFSGGH